MKWRNYPHSENTWEPIDNMDCPELVKEYEDKIAKERDERKQKEKEVSFLQQCLLFHYACCMWYAYTYSNSNNCISGILL